jgi:hypothetical protein
VVFATQAGNCSSTNSVPFAVSGTRVSSAGGGKVTGGISRGGIVSVTYRSALSQGQRQRPAGRQRRHRPLERRHHRRQMQRQLAGDAELTFSSSRRRGMCYRRIVPRKKMPARLI